MADDLFAGVAKWWDRDALQSEKATVMRVLEMEQAYARVPWSELEGHERERIYFGMRRLSAMGKELSKVVA